MTIPLIFDLHIWIYISVRDLNTYVFVSVVPYKSACEFACATVSILVSKLMCNS